MRAAALAIFVLLAASFAVFAGCSSSSTSSGSSCTGLASGAACSADGDCKPTTCKCGDGTSTDTARACSTCVSATGNCPAAKICDDPTALCNAFCKTNGGVTSAVPCS